MLVWKKQFDEAQSIVVAGRLVDRVFTQVRLRPVYSGTIDGMSIALYDVALAFDRSAGQQGCQLDGIGRFHSGRNTIAVMFFEKIGVCVLGAPTTTRSSKTV